MCVFRALKASSSEMPVQQPPTPLKWPLSASVMIFNSNIFFPSSSIPLFIDSKLVKKIVRKLDP